MKTPEEWMRDFETKIADAQAKAAAVQEGLARAGGSASSPDGAVSVTVAPNGALTDVRLTADAMRKSPGELSAEIMSVARKAQRSAAVQVAETFEAVNGAGSETYRLITEYLPDDEDPEDGAEEQRLRFLPEDEAEPAPVPDPPARPSRPAPRRDRGDEGDDGDFSVESLFGKK